MFMPSSNLEQRRETLMCTSNQLESTVCFQFISAFTQASDPQLEVPFTTPACFGLPDYALVVIVASLAVGNSEKLTFDHSLVGLYLIPQERADDMYLIQACQLPGCAEGRGTGGAGDSEDGQVFGCCCLISITVHALPHSCEGMSVRAKRKKWSGVLPPLESLKKGISTAPYCILNHLYL